MYGLLAWVYIWLTQMLWRLDPAAWLFLAVITVFNLVLNFIVMVTGNAFTDVSTAIVVNALILLYVMLPGTKKAFGMDKPPRAAGCLVRRALAPRSRSSLRRLAPERACLSHHCPSPASFRRIRSMLLAAKSPATARLAVERAGSHHLAFDRSRNLHHPGTSALQISRWSTGGMPSRARAPAGDSSASLTAARRSSTCQPEHARMASP